MATILETHALAASFGDESTPSVFDGIDLRVERGELLTIVGASGTGKSTLLRVVADLLAPSAGEVHVHARPDPSRRATALVFQEARLMPWRSVEENVQLGLEGLGVDPQTCRERVKHALELVGLGDYRQRWPRQLSGGQRQRVGIARALAVEPDLLLMDEPFGALDAITRQSLQDELRRIWRETQKSILFVTHDIEEAVYLGQRVLLIGGSPAHIVSTFDVGEHTSRDDPAVIDCVREIKSALHATLATDCTN